MNKITIIANNANGREVFDGGRIKIRLFINLLKLEGCDVEVVELEGWKRNFLKIVKQIRQSVIQKRRIIIMAGPKGCRLIIPIVFHINKRHKTNIVFCPLGIGTLDSITRKLSIQETTNFLSCENFYKKKDKKMGKMLASFNYVLVQNCTLQKCYSIFYQLSNVYVLENFRTFNIKNKIFSKGDILKTIFYSRVTARKGILDLMFAVNHINSLFTNPVISLDIYGENQLETKSDALIFDSQLNSNVTYKGVISSNESIQTIAQYDLFCLPTKYYGEGTPGSLVESFIAGTPVLVSSYSQSKDLIDDSIDGYIFELNNVDDLIKKLRYIYMNKDKLIIVSRNAQQRATKYTYAGNRHFFLKYIAGVEE